MFDVIRQFSDYNAYGIENGAYERLAEKKQITWAPCWSHIRRKFFEAETDPPFRDWVLRRIKYLFLLERIAWSRSADERLKIRQEKENPHHR